MSDIVGNPEDTCSRDMAHISIRSFRKGRVQTVSMRAKSGHFVSEFSLPEHIKVQKGTSILDHLALYGHLHSFTGTIGIFLC